MPKVYNKNWNIKALSINFNQKQWRQDFGAFVKEQLSWLDNTYVTRAQNDIDKSSKYFEVFNVNGDKVCVYFKNQKDVISSTHVELVNKYLEKRAPI